MHVLIATCLIIGVLFSFFAALGILRMPDAYIRIHSATKAGTLGLGFIMIALALYFQDTTVTSRALGIIAFTFMTSPVAAHLLGRSLLLSDQPMWHGYKQQG